MFDINVAKGFYDFERNYEIVGRVEGEIINDRGKITVTINDSHIKTKIIKAVGQNVDVYASDVLYDLKRIDEAIERAKQRLIKGDVKNSVSELLTIGLRDLGVDNGIEMAVRISQGEDYHKVYKAVYHLVITTAPCELEYALNITMDLFRDKNFNDKEVR